MLCIQRTHISLNFEGAAYLIVYIFSTQPTTEKEEQKKNRRRQKTRDRKNQMKAPHRNCTQSEYGAQLQIKSICMSALLNAREHCGARQSCERAAH